MTSHKSSHNASIPQLPIIVWDDEALSLVMPDNRYLRIFVICKPHADDWRTDLEKYAPRLALIDADMGAKHQSGWVVCQQLQSEFPAFPIICITRNIVARIRMVRDGAEFIPKANVSTFLSCLDIMASKYPINEAIRRSIAQVGVDEATV